MLDNFVDKYRIAVKGKTWWWPLFINTSTLQCASMVAVSTIARKERLSAKIQLLGRYCSPCCQGPICGGKVGTLSVTSCDYALRRNG